MLTNKSSRQQKQNHTDHQAKIENKRKIQIQIISITNDFFKKYPFSENVEYIFNQMGENSKNYSSMSKGIINGTESRSISRL